MTHDEKKNRIEQLKSLFEEASDVFVAIGDKTRQSLIFDIIDAGNEGIDVASLTKNSVLSRPAVSHHLKVMKDAGILSARKSGTQVFYSVRLQYGVLEQIRELVSGIENLIANDAGYGADIE
jgi:DNA-binding transcriptional ArsR family regulator